MIPIPPSPHARAAGAECDVPEAARTGDAARFDPPRERLAGATRRQEEAA
jgi:hypothetical protein